MKTESLVHAGFQEGLSLTVHDEILRYCKYAYGCSEMMFNSVWEWPRKGVLSKLFVTYIRLKSIPWCATPRSFPLLPHNCACPHMFCLNAERQLIYSLLLYEQIRCVAEDYQCSRGHGKAL